MKIDTRLRSPCSFVNCSASVGAHKGEEGVLEEIILRADRAASIKVTGTWFKAVIHVPVVSWPVQ